jgi:hypothetical protein
MPYLETTTRQFLVGGVANIGAKTTTFNTDALINDMSEACAVTVFVSAVSGTTPTLTAKLQWSPDNGTTWLDLDATNAITASINAAGNYTFWVHPGAVVAAALSANKPVPRELRIACTIGGTTPSFTITGIYLNGMGT